MRIYFDTEFTQFRDGQMLSAGFVADDDRCLYVEVDEPGRRQTASDFCHQQVLTQFGLMPDTNVRTDAEAGQRIAEWLLNFGAPLTLSYDYKLDWRYLESTVIAAGLWTALLPRIQEHNIASEANQDQALAAQESYLAQRTRPGRHHALVDAYALRERWRSYQRLVAAGSAA